MIHKFDLEFINYLTSKPALGNYNEGLLMGEEKIVKKGRSVAISGVIGFVLLALLVGMIIGGAISLLVIAPYIGQLHQQSSSNQNGNYQNGSNNQGPTSNPNNNNQNNYNQGPTSNPYNNNQNGYNNGPTGSPSGYNNQPNTGNQSNQNNTNSQSMINNNPSITNPTAQYNSTGNQFSVNVPNQNGGHDSGTITADVTCVVQQTGNNIQLDLTITPTNVPQTLSQDIQTTNSVTFNFAGTSSGSQFNAQASGAGGSDSTSPTFNLTLSGSFGTNTLTITISSASGSQISISTPHSLTLQNS